MVGPRGVVVTPAGRVQVGQLAGTNQVPAELQTTSSLPVSALRRLLPAGIWTMQDCVILWTVSYPAVEHL